MKTKTEAFFSQKIPSDISGLLLTNLIEQQCDSSYKGRVCAYFNPKFKEKAEFITQPLTESIDFKSYCINYLVGFLDQIQREKYLIMSEMVQLIEDFHATQSSNPSSQNSFLLQDQFHCEILLPLIDLCMSLETKQCKERLQHYKLDHPKKRTGETIEAPQEIIKFFWDNILKKNPMPTQQQFIKLRDELIAKFIEGLQCNNKFMEMQEYITPHLAHKPEGGVCISWIYLEVICHFLKKEIDIKDANFIKFKTTYITSRNDLTKVVFPIVDFWLAVRKEMQDIERTDKTKQNTLYTSLQNISKLFASLYKDCKPPKEVKQVFKP